MCWFILLALGILGYFGFFGVADRMPSKVEPTRRDIEEAMRNKR